MAYLTVLSVWREVIVALFEVCSWKLYGIFKETVKKLGIASISAKIWNCHHLIVKQQYFLTDLSVTFVYEVVLINVCY